MTSNPCQLVNGILSYEDQILYEVNAKFDSLKRLVQLIYEAGEALLHLIPNPADFIPSAMIDLSLYQQLVANCPMLGLPMVPSLAPLEMLREEVSQAYYGLFAGAYLNHPWSMIEEYQSQVNEAIANAYSTLGRDWLICANAVCGTVDVLTHTSITDRFSAIAASPSLLIAKEKSAYNDFLSRRDSVRNLLSDEASLRAWGGFFPPPPLNPLA